MGERRLQWLAGIVVLWGAAIFWNLVKLEVFHHKEYVRIAHKTRKSRLKFPRRGAPFSTEAGSRWR